MQAKQQPEEQPAREQKNRRSPETKGDLGRKMKYETPRLISYGSVEGLTKSGGSTQPDAHQARQVHPGNH